MEFDGFELNEIEDIERNIETNAVLREVVYKIYSKLSDTTLCEILYNSKNTNFTKKYPKTAFVVRDTLHRRGWNPYPDAIDNKNNFIGLQ